MTAIVAIYLAGIWAIVVAGANLNAYRSPVQEGNDYGKKHKTS